MMKIKSSLLMSTALIAGLVAGTASAQDHRDSRTIESLNIPEALGGADIPLEIEGDNLGNHVAEQDLEMAGHDVNTIRHARMTGMLFGPMHIQMQTGGRIIGLALQPMQDSEAASKWYVDQQVAGARDNLGNHTATQNIDAAGNSVVNVADADLSEDGDAVNVRVLRGYVRDNGDNLGSHVASETLVMSGNDIDLTTRDAGGNATGEEGGKIVNMGEPSDPADGATKRYVDEQIDNLEFPEPPKPPAIEGGDGIRDIADGADPIVIDVDETVVRSDLEISTPPGSGLNGGGPLTGDISLELDDTVVRTFGDQDVGGVKTFTDPTIFAGRTHHGDGLFVTDSGRDPSSEGIHIYREPSGENRIAGSGPQSLWINNDRARLIFGPQGEPGPAATLEGVGKIRLAAPDVAGGAGLNGQWIDVHETIDLHGPVNVFNDMDMGNFEIGNLRDPVDPQDAVNLRTLQSLVGGAAIGDNLGNHTATEDLKMVGNDIRLGAFDIDMTQQYSAQSGQGLLIGKREWGDNAYVMQTDALSPIRIGNFNGDNFGMGLHINTADLDGTTGNIVLTSPATTKVVGNRLARVNSFDTIRLDVWKDGTSTEWIINKDNIWTNANINFWDPKQIKGLADPTQPQDAVNLRTLQAAISGSISSVSGDNMGNHTATQNINAANFRLQNLSDPAAAGDAVNLGTLQDYLSDVVTLADDQTITGLKTFRANTTVFQRDSATGSSLGIQPGSSGSGTAYIRGPNGNGTLIMAAGSTTLVPGTMVPDGRRITPGAGLTGGGLLTGDITLAVDADVVRSGITQTIGGSKTFTYDVTVTNTRVGQTALRATNTGAGSSAFFCNDTRNAAGCGGNRAWTNSSDERLKTDITDLEPERGLEAIRQIRPVTYLWKEEGLNDGGKRSLGLIAQNVEAFYPELVFTSPMERTVDGKVITDSKTMSYAELVSPLILSVQQLDAKDAESTAKIEELSAALAAMEARVAALEAR